LKDMDPEIVLRNLTDSFLFLEDEIDQIMSVDGLTRQDRCKRLLEILSRRGPKAYETFKETIKELYPHLFGKIEEAGK